MEWSKESALAFIANNIKITDEGCHEWQGSINRDGYGQLSTPIFGIKGVHRLSLSLNKDHEFASRHEQTLHTCHNRRCCNPDHLEVGTAQENMRAAREAGRTQRGDAHYHAKLTGDQVLSIRERLSLGARVCDLARLFGVAADTIQRIKRGTTWTHLISGPIARV